MTRQAAAFDFDGTLSTSDTLLPYLRAVAGLQELTLAAVAAAPQLLAGALSDRRRDAAKAAMVQRVLGGRREDWLRALGARHADAILTHHLRPEMVTRLEWHRDAGHDLVIVSASPTLYLDAVGEGLGVDAVLATELEVGPDGCLTGRLSGANVRRAEKVRRLEAWLGDANAEIWAYGDSTGDRELLERADHPMKV